MELKAKLKKLAVQMGADFFGIADLTPAQEAIKNLWEKSAAQYPREIRYDAHKCDKYLSKLEKTSALGVCGMCLYVCPYGRKPDSSP